MGLTSLIARRALPWAAAIACALGAAPAPLPGQQPGAPQAARQAVGAVRGTVLDAEQGTPVVRATVSLAGTARGVMTDDDGRFLFDGLPAGSVTLRIRALGYRAIDQQVIVPGGGVAELAVRLEAVPQRLSTVRTRVRAAEREQFEQAPDVGSFSIRGSTLASVPSIGEPDVLRTVQLLPGVLARSDYTAGYNVRGGESDQNLVLLDGIPVYNPFHFGGLFGTFLDETVSDVNLLTGGFPASYGGRLSSVLDVTTADESRQGVHGQGAVSLLASSLSLGGALPDAKTNWGIAGRRTYADALISVVTDRVFPYHFQDGQLRARRQLGNDGSLTFTGYAGQDALDGNFSQFDEEGESGGGDFLFNWGNQLAGVTWQQPLRDKPAIPLGGTAAISLGDSALLVQQASVSRFGTELDLGRGSLRFTNSIRELRLAGSLAWFGSRHARRAGYEYSQHSVRYNIRSSQAGAALFGLSQQPSAISLYFDDTWRANDRFLMRLGLRGETVTGRNWYGISPRLAAKFFLNRDLALTLSGGQFTQWVHAVRNEDVPVRIFDFWVASDRFVDVSAAQHAVIGLEQWFGDSRFVRVEGYGKRYERVTEPNDADDPGRRGDEFNLVHGTSYGVDVLVRQLEGERLSGWVAYSWGVSSRERDGSRYFPAQDRRHNLNAVLSYRAGRNYLLGGRFGFGTGTPYTDIVGQIVRRTYDGGQNQWDTGITNRPLEPVGGTRNGSRYPSYQRLDLSVTRRFERGRTVISPYLQVVNTYNYQNVFIYTHDYTANPPTKESISQFPILPSLGVTVDF